MQGRSINRMEGRQGAWGSTAWGPLPWSSPAPSSRHTLGSPMGEEPPCLQGENKFQDRKTQPGRQGFPSSRVHLSPAGKALGLQRLKRAPCLLLPAAMLHNNLSARQVRIYLCIKNCLERTGADALQHAGKYASSAKTASPNISLF